MISVEILKCVAQLKSENKKPKISEPDLCAMLSFIFGIISLPFIFTGIFWMLPAFFSVAVGLLSLKNKTEKKRLAVAGILCAVISAVILVVLFGIW